MIAFPCSQCGKGLKAKDELAGKRVKCPACGKVSAVPAEAVSHSASGSATRANTAVEPRTPAPPDAPALSSHDAPTLLPGEMSAGEAAKQPPGETVPEVPSSGARSKTGTFPAEWTQFLAPAQAPDEIGRLGGYRILTVLGAGGMGVVFKAEDPHLKRLVAIKAMLPGLALTDAARKRFSREAQIAAAIEHDHIVHIYQVGEDRDVPFIAMQFLKGEPLDVCLKREGALPIAEVLRIGRETAEGLAAAHARGLIHRDIKPANIWLEARSDQRSALRKGTDRPNAERSSLNAFRVKILDFGLARGEASDTNLTLQGAIVGTPAYMAPEQAAGEAVDARCDLFSLGCVLYRLCTGDVPFRGADTIATLVAVATEKPRRPRDVNAQVPQALSDLIMQLLEKKPAQRPASAGAVAHALQTLEAELARTAEPPGRSESKLLSSLVRRSGEPPRNRRWLIAAGVLAVVVTATAFFILRRPNNNDARRQTNNPVPGEWIALFNGKDLSGWKKHPEQTKGDWLVTADGILEGHGGGNYLFSERGDYGDFHLRVEAKISRGTNAGLFLRSPFALGFDLRALGGQGKMPTGYEIEIVSPATDPDVPTGSIWTLTPKPRVAKSGRSAMEDDGWFVLEVIAQGRHVRTRVNDQQAAETEDGTFANGHIVLQVLSAPGTIQFRKIEIKELPAAPVEQVSPPTGPCPADSLKRSSIPLELLKAAGDGDIGQAPRELAAIVRSHDAEKVAVAAVSPDGKWLALGSAPAHPPWVSLVDLSSGTEHRHLTLPGQDNRAVADLVFSPDSKHLVVSTNGGLVRIWSMEKNAAVKARPLTPSRAGTYTLAFSPDNRTLALAQSGAVEPVRLVDLSALDLDERSLRFSEAVTALAFSPDGQTLACGTAPGATTAGTVQIWDVTTGKRKLVPVKGLAHQVVRLRFFADGKRLAYTINTVPECFVLDLASQKVDKLVGPGAGTSTFDLAPQGVVAVAAQKDSRIFVHDPAQPGVRRVNIGPLDIMPRQIRFTPEGRHLVSVNSDGGVYVLRLASPPATTAATPPKKTGPKDIASEISGGLDLLKLIDLKRDAVAGQWKMVDGVLQGRGTSEKGDYFLNLPAAPPAAYRLHILVRRLSPAPLWLGISSGKGRGLLALTGTYTDFGLLDGKMFHVRAEKSNHHHQIFNGSTTTYLRVSVRPKHVYVTADGEVLYSWKGDFLKQLSRWNNHPTQALYLGGYGLGGYAFEQIVLEPLMRKTKKQ